MTVGSIYRLLAGEPRALKYTVNALCAMEEVEAQLGVEEMPWSRTRLLLWGALISTDPHVRLKDAGDIIGEHLARGGKMTDVTDACLAALTASGLAPEEGDDDGAEEDGDGGPAGEV